MTLGEKIYKLRSEKNLSQGDLSELLGVSRQSVSKWENDGAIPDLDKIVKLAEIFGITIDELVKGEDISAPAEEKPAEIIVKKESVFPPRKIIGTILLSLSLIIAFICFVIGGIEGVFAGILFSSPLILCGIVCFVFKKNVGLWCAWAVFFCVDMYIRLAMGINRHYVLNIQTLLFYLKGGGLIQIAISLAQLAALLVLIAVTVLRFRNIPLESKKLPIIFWAIYGILKIAMAAFSASHLYLMLMNYLLATYEVWIYTLFSSLYSWIYTGFFVAAVVLTVRYFITKKRKTF